MTDTPPVDAQRGLYEKFNVKRREDPTGKHADCSYFVLDPVHDRHARAALDAYADSCEAELPNLARDLRRQGGHPMTDTPPVDAQPVEPLTAQEVATIITRHTPVQMVTRGLFGSFYWLCEADGARSARDIPKPVALCDAMRLALDAARAGDGLLREVREWSEAADRASTEDDTETLWRHREFVAVQRVRRCIGDPNTARDHDDEPRWSAALHATATEEPKDAER